MAINPRVARKNSAIRLKKGRSDIYYLPVPYVQVSCKLLTEIIYPESLNVKMGK
jgi:hypothetical protein